MIFFIFSPNEPKRPHKKSVFSKLHFFERFFTHCVAVGDFTPMCKYKCTITSAVCFCQVSHKSNSIFLTYRVCCEKKSDIFFHIGHFLSTKIRHSLIRGVLIQSCSAGAKNFSNSVFCHPQFSGVIENHCAILTPVCLCRLLSK